MSISFTCLFLVFFFWLFIIISFISLEKENQNSNLFTFLLLCVRVFLKETCVEKPKREKKAARKFSVCLCVYDSRFDFSFSSSSFFLWVAAVFQTVFSVFFFMPPLSTAAAAVFLYLFIKRLCVCMCQLLLSAVCSRACVQFTHFILLFLFVFVY